MVGSILSTSAWSTPAVVGTLVWIVEVEATVPTHSFALEGYIFYILLTSWHCSQGEAVTFPSLGI